MENKEFQLHVYEQAVFAFLILQMLHEASNELEIRLIHRTMTHAQFLKQISNLVPFN